MVTRVAGMADGRSFVFPVEQRWCTGERLFGGAAFGAVVSALEVAAGRPTIAAMAQFVTTGCLGQSLSITTEVMVAGSGATQARATAVSAMGIVAHVSAALGSLDGAGAADSPSLSPMGAGRVVASVAPPEACPAREYHHPLAGSITETLDVRIASVELDRATVVLWARWIDAPTSASPAPVLALLSDHVPYGVRLVQGAELYGVSLDATLRVMPAAAAWEPSAWVLLEIAYDMLGAFGHATVRLRDLHGQSLAIATQTLRIRHW